MSVIDTLIFDRKQSDIANDTDKAYISYTDLNRVEEAITYLKQLLANYGYNSTTQEKKWLISDFRKNEDMSRLKDNIDNLRNAYPYLVSPVTPNPIKYESIQEANDIEEILYKINEIIINMTQNFIHCGVANCGQNRVWQNKFRRQNWLPVKYELTNLISDPSFENNQWSGANYSTVEKLFDSRSLYFPTGTTVIASIVIDRPIVSHKYYGRRYIKTNGNNQPADCRFEVYGGDGANLNWVYAWNNGNHQEWEFGSAIHEITAVGYAENVNTIIRCFNVNTTTNTWIDGVMLIDLTDCFGEGKEPTKQWCDEHIPFFEGTQIIEVKENIKEG